MAGACALVVGATAACSPAAAGRSPDVARLAVSDPAVAEVYRAHGDQLLWLSDGVLNDRGRLLVETLLRAGEDGLDPGRYIPAGLASADGDAAALDVGLSRGLVAYAADLRRPTGAARFVFTDNALPPSGVRPEQVLEQIAFGAAPQQGLAALRRINPIYDGLREALIKQRLKPATTPQAVRAERLILINMDRARPLPQDFGQRHVWVDIPVARLTAFEGGTPRLSMAVVVGKPQMQTPMMVGLLRYAVVNPYWNIPEDLVRDSIAPKVLRQGVSYLKNENLEVLSDWTETATGVSATDVAWKDVASGAVSLRVRQKPGPSNMMGAVKLMSPNTMGIYLHDTPHRDLFARASRTFSSGCVRLEDAGALSRWLFGADPRSSTAPPETRVDLARPTPLYLTYFTAVPTAGGGIEFRDDIYGLDKAALGTLATRDAQRGAG